MTRFIPALALLFSLSNPVFAQSPDGNAVQAALHGLAGSWEGELAYLDYQSGARFEIPMAIDADETPDGNFLRQTIVFTDPSRTVYAFTFSTIDAERGLFLESYHREGRIELFAYDLAGFDQTDATHWTLKTTEQGMDDDRTALITHIMSRNGDRLTTQKTVRFQGEADAFLRNETVLTRTGD